MQKDCEHQQVKIDFQVSRVGPQGQSLLDLEVICTQCDEPFVFTIGSPQPQTLRLAIVPASLHWANISPARRIIVPSLREVVDAGVNGK